MYKHISPTIIVVALFAGCTHAKRIPPTTVNSRIPIVVKTDGNTKFTLIVQGGGIGIQTLPAYVHVSSRIIDPSPKYWGVAMKIEWGDGEASGIEERSLPPYEEVEHPPGDWQTGIRQTHLYRHFGEFTIRIVILHSGKEVTSYTHTILVGKTPSQ